MFYEWPVADQFGLVSQSSTHPVTVDLAPEAETELDQQGQNNTAGLFAPRDYNCNNTTMPLLDSHLEQIALSSSAIADLPSVIRSLS